MLLSFVCRTENPWSLFDVRGSLEGAEGHMIMCNFQMRIERMRGSDQVVLGVFLQGFILLFGWWHIDLNWNSQREKPQVEPKRGG